MDRKNFLLLAAAGIAAISIPTYFYLRNTSSGPLPAQPESLSLICDTETMNAIGNAYRLQVPEEQKERSLVDLLAGTSADNVDLEQTIKKEFEAGKTVMVDGWVLSVTEARQCALFSIIQSR